MPVHFNHVAIAAHDRLHSAAFLAELLGLAEPTSWGPFTSVTLDDGVPFWADPAMRHPGEINTNHAGRGVYFDDPAGHHFELITQPYGSAA